MIVWILVVILSSGNIFTGIKFDAGVAVYSNQQSCERDKLKYSEANPNLILKCMEQKVRK